MIGKDSIRQVQLKSYIVGTVGKAPNAGQDA